MKKYLIYITIISFLLPGHFTYGQKGVTRMELSYGVNIPSGSFKDFISKTAPRGWQVQVTHGLTDHLSIGGATGFQDYYEKYPRQVYETTSGDHISAVISNSVQTIPLQVAVRYDFLPSALVKPYVSAGAGGNFITLKQYLGEYTNLSKGVIRFAFSTEAGCAVAVGKTKETTLGLSAGYNIMPLNSDGVKNLNNIGIKAGLRFSIR